MALPEYPDLEELLDYITGVIKRLLDTQGALVILLDEERKEFFFPGAIAGIDPSGASGTVFSQLSYFSFVTLTTLGYGDLTPVHPFCQSLAIVESVVGVLFPALIVAASPNFRRFVAYDVETEPPTSDSLSSVLDGAEA